MLQNLLISILFRCPACNHSSESRSFPYCTACIDSLTPCPPLCKNCASPACIATSQLSCSRQWIKNDLIDSFHAGYVLAGPGYKVLKRWKVRHGIFSDKRILKVLDTFCIKLQKLNIQAIIPMPQKFKRSWAIGGSPAEKIAHTISKKSKIPLMTALKICPSTTQGKRQAELSQIDRIQNKLNFSVASSEIDRPISDILLVDDFMTTGHTLRQAAHVLKISNAGKIHVFCLGIRLDQAQQHTHLGYCT